MSESTLLMVSRPNFTNSREYTRIDNDMSSFFMPTFLIFDNWQSNLFSSDNDIFSNYRPEYRKCDIFMQSNHVDQLFALESNLKCLAQFDSNIEIWDKRSIFRAHIKICLDNVNCLFSLDEFKTRHSLSFATVEKEQIFYWLMFNSTTLLCDNLRQEIGYAKRYVSSLVLDLDGDGIELVNYGQGVYFDIDNDGFVEKVGWPGPNEGQLVIDNNGNGRIDDITELFGDDFIRAFFKLSFFDSNNDKIIDYRDRDFGKLLIWQDKNSNGISEKSELTTLLEKDITNITLTSQITHRIVNNHIISEASSFSKKNGKIYEIVNVYYSSDDLDSWYIGKKNLIDKQRLSRDIHKLVIKILNKLDQTSNYLNDWLAINIEAETIKFNHKVAKTFNVAQYDPVYIEQRKSAMITDNQRRLKQQESILLKRHQEYLAKQVEMLINVTITEANTKLSVEKLALITEANLKIAKYNSELAEEINADANNKLIYKNFLNKRALFQSNDNQIQSIRSEFADYMKDQFDQRAKVFVNQIKQELNTRLDHLKSDLINDANIKINELKQNLQVQQLHNITREMYSLSQKFSKESIGVAKLLWSLSNDRKSAIETQVIIWQETARVVSNMIYEFINSNLVDRDDSIKVTRFTQLKQYLDDKIDHIIEIMVDGQNTKIVPEALLMPIMRGFGQLPALPIAISENDILKQKIINFMLIKPEELRSSYLKILDILYCWAKITPNINTAPIVNGFNIEPAKITFLEKITGQEFKHLGVAKIFGSFASVAIENAWNIFLIKTYINLVIQGPLYEIFKEAKYSFASDTTILNTTFEVIVKRVEDYSSANNLGYNFFINIGYILSAYVSELKITKDVIRLKLNEWLDKPLDIDLGIFQLIGNDRDNIIVGTDGPDYIKGFGGNDSLDGKDGADHINGGSGDDNINGGAGLNRLFGGAGDDTIIGGQDCDFAYGGAGSDTIKTNDGDDLVEGGEDPDYMDGGRGSNTLSYGSSYQGVYVNLAMHEAKYGDAEGDQFTNFVNLEGSHYNDTLIGDNHANYINGLYGNDTIYGGSGDDILSSHGGINYLFGEEGNDHFICFDGIYHVDGGGGYNTISYNNPYSSEGVKINLTSGLGIGGYAYGDTYKNVQNVKGTDFEDEIIGNDDNNILNGFMGTNKIFGLGGNDIIISMGFNILDGGEGDDTFVISNVNGFIDGGTGSDTVSFEFLVEGINFNLHKLTKHIINVENIIGTNFDDNIIGNNNNNIINCLNGSDTINAMAGDDHIMSGLGNKTIDGGLGKDTIDYSSEKNIGIVVDLGNNITKNGIAMGDTLISIENVIGTKFDDKLIGDNQNNILIGREGNNTLIGGDGNDIFVIGLGSNNVTGGVGHNIISYTDSLCIVSINLSDNFVNKCHNLIDVFTNIIGVIGSEFDDNIIGDSDNNHLSGERGNDIIDGGKGNDIIDGGEGNNTLIGGPDNDKFRATLGTNNINGGDGIDTVDYSDYRLDRFNFIAQQEKLGVVNGSMVKFDHHYIKSNLAILFDESKTIDMSGFRIDLAKNMTFKANNQIDRMILLENVIGTHFDDIIIGDNRNNELNGLDGNNRIYGNGGDDTLVFGYGNNYLNGGNGNDLFIYRDSSQDFTAILLAGVASIDGGNGIDTLDLSHYPFRVLINLNTKQIDYDFRISHKIMYVEQIITTQYNDLVIDSDDDNAFSVGDGDDVVRLAGGNDNIDLGDGNDILEFCAGGRKLVLGGFGSDTYKFMPTFKSFGINSSIIIDDFEINRDKLDLSNLPHLKNIEDISIGLKKIAFTSSNDEVESSIVKFNDHQEIILIGIMLGNLSSDNFIFN